MTKKNALKVASHGIPERDAMIGVSFVIIEVVIVKRVGVL